MQANINITKPRQLMCIIVLMIFKLLLQSIPGVNNSITREKAVWMIYYFTPLTAN